MGQKERDATLQALQAAQKAVEAGNFVYTRGHSSYKLPKGDPVGAALQAGSAALGVRTTGDPDLDWIMQKESSGRVSAKNPKSSAFGLGQLIASQRRRYAQKLGIQDPDTTNFGEQLGMMQAYIKDRYGSASAAKKHWEKHGWY